MDVLPDLVYMGIERVTFRPWLCGVAGECGEIEAGVHAALKVVERVLEDVASAA